MNRLLREIEIDFDHDKFADVGEVIEDIISRHLGALAKGQIIHPPVSNVSLNYVDFDAAVA